MNISKRTLHNIKEFIAGSFVTVGILVCLYDEKIIIGFIIVIILSLLALYLVGIVEKCGEAIAFGIGPLLIMISVSIYDVLVLSVIISNWFGYIKLDIDWILIAKMSLISAIISTVIIMSMLIYDRLKDKR